MKKWQMIIAPRQLRLLYYLFPGLAGYFDTPFIIQVFLTDHLAHGFVINLAFHPGNDVEVLERPGLEPAFLKSLDRMQEIFKFGL